MKNSLIFSVLVCFITLQLQLYSQVTQEWVRRYSGTGNVDDVGNTIRVDKYGNVVVSGILNHGIAVLKYDNIGNLLWMRNYSGSFRGKSNKSLEIDNNGNIYVMGSTYGNNFDIFVISYDTEGNLRWVSTYSSSGYSLDQVVKLKMGKDGFLYFLGTIEPIIYDFFFLTIKYDPLNGDTIWTEIFGGHGTGAYDMVLDDSSNIYVTGSDSGGINTLKYDSKGVLKWKTIPTWGEPAAIEIDKIGNCFVTGDIYGAINELDCKTIKYDSQGNTSWIKLYNNVYYDSGVTIAVDDSSNAYVAAYSENAHYQTDIAVLKYDINGNEKWIRRYAGFKFHDDYPTKIILDHSQNCYVVGSTCYYGTFTRQITTLKYSNSGSLLWLQNYWYIFDGDDLPFDIIMDSLENFYVTGESYGPATGYDIVTVKYSQLVGIVPISSEIPNHFSISQNYPNPFNPDTKIRFSIPTPLNPPEGGKFGREVSLRIFDILGREVVTLVNEQLKPGSYEVDFDASNYPSGVYFYQLMTGDYSEVKKMVLIK